MSSEMNQGRVVRFRRERESKYKPQEGSWESVLVGLKAEYPEDVFGVDEAGYWIPIEEKASMNLKEACFQFFLVGTGHITLAKQVLDANPRMKTAIGLGAITTQERQGLVDRLSEFLYEYYPERYKTKISK